MTEQDNSKEVLVEKEFPSVENLKPSEEGGPIARSGFSYQDYVAAMCVVEMMGDENCLSVQCETLDDIVVVTEHEGERTAEFVQVKREDSSSLWSIARLCEQSKEDTGKSIFEKSLAKDCVCETAIFRIVTSQEINSDLKPLTFERGHAERSLGQNKLIHLKDELDKRCPDAKGDKGADSAYWLKNVRWDVCGSQAAVKNRLIIAAMNLAAQQGMAILIDQAQKIMQDLLVWVKKAGDARYVPDRLMKIISCEDALTWWTEKVLAEIDGVSVPSGGKLRKKLKAPVASPDMVEAATQFRREYATEVRTPKYMEMDESSTLQRRIKSELYMLRSRRYSGDITDNPSQFHQRCLTAVIQIALELEDSTGSAEVFAKGCMYDITDRCQHAFGDDSE